MAYPVDYSTAADPVTYLYSSSFSTAFDGLHTDLISDYGLRETSLNIQACFQWDQEGKLIDLIEECILKLNLSIRQRFEKAACFPMEPGVNQLLFFAKRLGYTSLKAPGLS